MKKLLLALLTIIILAAVLVAGSGFALKTTVEETLKTELGIGMPGTESAAQEISFAPLTRKITVRDWRFRKQQPSEVLSGSVRSMEAVIPLKGVLACLPSIGSLFSGADAIPILENIHLQNMHYVTREGTSTIDTVDFAEIRIKGSLLNQWLAGTKPPFDETVAGLEASDLSFSNVTYIGSDRSVSNVQSIQAPELHGASLPKVTMKTLVAHLPETEVVTAFKLECTDIKISPALLSEYLSIAEKQGDLTEPELDSLLRAVKANGPVITRLTATDVHFGEGRDALPIGSVDAVWKNVVPFTFDAQLRNIRLPQAAVVELLPTLGFSGGMVCQADLSLEAGDTAHVHTIIRADKLGDLTVDGTGIPASQAITSLRLSFRDTELMPRLSRTVSPDPAVAAMLLRAGANMLCANDTQEDRQTCARLGDFIQAPGTITLETRPGIRLTLDELVACWLSQRLGHYFTATVKRGSRTLTQAVADLNAQGGK